jgi:hypothetical protein
MEIKSDTHLLFLFSSVPPLTDILTLLQGNDMQNRQIKASSHLSHPWLRRQTKAETAMPKTEKRPPSEEL